MSRKEIYEKDPYYTVLKPYVGLYTKRSYRRTEVRGEENIPTDGAVIFAPNHCNTLMDALVILQAYKEPIVFGARADMFNKPFVAKLMYFFRILPMVRQRDGFRNVLKNYESFDKIVDCLEHNVKFCMFPEGRHRALRSLLNLGKGITRAAIAAHNRFGKERPVYIVPVGIEYGDYFRFRSTCLISYGKAINVSEFVKDMNSDNEAQVMEQLKRELRNRMSQLITFIEDDDKFNSKWALTKLLARGKRNCRLSERLKNNQEVIREIESAIEAKPEQMEEVLERASDFDKKIHKAGISIKSFGKSSLLLNCILKGILALLGLPYFIFSAVVSLPMWAVATYIKSGLRDKAFGNTVNFGVKLGLSVIWYAIIAVISFCCLKWEIALAVSLAALPTYNFVYDYLEFVRLFISDCKLMFSGKLNNESKEIIDSFSRIK